MTRLRATSVLRHLCPISTGLAGLLLLGAGNPQSSGFAQKLSEPSPAREDALDNAPSLLKQTPVPKASPQEFLQGDQVSLNGRTFPVAWSRWQINKDLRQYRYGISDMGLRQIIGVELLNTKDATRQPVEWFSQPTTTPNNLTARLTGQFRYLDITELAKLSSWRIEIDGQTLRIASAPARVQNIRTGKQPWGDRIVVDLDRPTPWQLSEQGQEWLVRLDAASDSSILQRFNPPTSGSTPTSSLPSPQTPTFSVQSTSNQTTLRLKVPPRLFPRVFTLANPNRLVIDIRPDALVERDLVWSPGVRWQQQYVSLQDSSRFPVVWLEINLCQPGLALKPIWSQPNVETLETLRVTSLQLTAPLLKTALMWQAAAAINGGFFNRNEQLPLGAIRRDGQWLSSPILNRGAIAWNACGQVKMGRLSLQETLITQDGKRLPIVALNSGYVQAGIARYTPEWGHYTPLIDGEILVFVRNNQVTGQSSGGTLGKTAFSIPSDGYLLTLRDNSAAAGLLTVGTNVRIESATIPDEFSRYPHILGAGPLLLQNRQIVLDAKAEKFSNAFIQETAARSAIGTTASGHLLVVTVHNRVASGGDTLGGPTLAQMASLMQQLGAIDALNLDGGSSTTLYLGGQVINRSSSTAARVHNGLGIFLEPNH